jgi:signal transduction histidine kinase
MALAANGSNTDWEGLASDTTEECDRLLEMINTTLDIAEAESGAAKLKISDVDLVALVTDACDLFQTVAEDKSIELLTELPEHCVIEADLHRLQRVLANLLDNAIKYTPAGGRVTVGLVDEDQRIRLSVNDSGVGISVDEQSRIFQRFYRCDWSRSEYGNGLGLSLALAFVRAHRGDITVSSRPGEGSRFTVVLPRSRRGVVPPGSVSRS